MASSIGALMLFIACFLSQLQSTHCDTLCGCESRFSALNALYASTSGGGGWTVRTGWGSTPACSSKNWHGVYCDGVDIYALVLDNNNLVGTLPSNLLQNFPELQVLYLDGNPLLRGLLSDGWSAGSSQIQNLSLSDTGMSGTLPAAWSAWTSLVLLYLDDLQITGTLPSSWSSMVNMSWLLLGNNSLTGTLPPSWSSMRKLQTLDVDTNSLSGALPTSWSALTQLQKLYLDFNSLTGTLPAGWSSLTHLQVLQLCSNQFSGTIPSSWNSAFTKLQVLDLSENDLSGTLPTLWSSFTMLQGLYVNNNWLTGTLPATWSTLVQLQDLFLSNNSFSGTIPEAWSRLSSIVNLYLDSNNMTGSLPSGWSVLTTLQYLALCNNSFTGTIPSQWSMMRALTSLWLYENRLSGTLPSALSALTSLLVLNVDENCLRGDLPTTYTSLNKAVVSTCQTHVTLPSGATAALKSLVAPCPTSLRYAWPISCTVTSTSSASNENSLETSVTLSPNSGSRSATTSKDDSIAVSESATRVYKTKSFSTGFSESATHQHSLLTLSSSLVVETTSNLRSRTFSASTSTTHSNTFHKTYPVRSESMNSPSQSCSIDETVSCVPLAAMMSLVMPERSCGGNNNGNWSGGIANLTEVTSALTRFHWWPAVCGGANDSGGDSTTTTSHEEDVDFYISGDCVVIGSDNMTTFVVAAPTVVLRLGNGSSSMDAMHAIEAHVYFPRIPPSGAQAISTKGPWSLVLPFTLGGVQEGSSSTSGHEWVMTAPPSFTDSPRASAVTNVFLSSLPMNDAGGCNTTTTTTDHARHKTSLPATAIDGFITYQLQTNDTSQLYGNTTTIELAASCGPSETPSVTLIRIIIHWPDARTSLIPSASTASIVPSSTATEVFTTSATMGTAIGGGGGAAASVVSTAILSLLACTENPPMSSTSYLVSFFFQYGPVAMAIGNAGLMVGVFLLHTVVVLSMAHISRQRPQRLSAATSSTARPGTIMTAAEDATSGSWSQQEGNGFIGRLVDQHIDTMKRCRFPSLSFAVASFLLPGCTLGLTAGLLRQSGGNGSGSAASGGNIFLCIVALLCVVFFAVVVKPALLYYIVFPRATFTPYRHYCIGTPIEKQWLFPKAYWTPQHIRTAFSSCMSTMQKPYAAICLTVETCLSCFIGVVAGVYMGGYCHTPILAIAAVLHLAYAIVLGVLRPYRMPMNQICCPIIYALMGTLCALKYRHLLSSAPAISSTSEDALQQIIAVLQIWKAIVSMFIGFGREPHLRAGNTAVPDNVEDHLELPLTTLLLPVDDDLHDHVAMVKLLPNDDLQSDISSIPDNNEGISGDEAQRELLTLQRETNEDDERRVNESHFWDTQGNAVAEASKCEESEREISERANDFETPFHLYSL
ncbi:GP46-like surface antigen, putative [Bodo saltans]|uniref:GP46-like surface antigen, putative n=1 Tax=Bodo saltans TaxID=75058 RepID=A0A0S4IS67_BODSA|nr:GP46-like surface antigen, putative [Bodo saltans]|eukprot:CUG05285.1 GP46-like surface antigen, putative [Bodo saltans]